jgi:hypothetical protein
MPRKPALLAMLAVVSVTLGSLGGAYAEGVIQKASKDVGKGLVKGVEQEIEAADLTKGAKQVTKGVLDGVSDAVPQVTSQMLNQANVNRKTMGKVAATVANQAMASAVDASIDEMTRSLGRKGDGPLADAMTATTERVVGGLVRGVKAETDFKIDLGPWPLVIGLVLGALSTVALASFLLLLYLAFQRRRVQVIEPVPAPADRWQGAGIGRQPIGARP